MLFAGFTVSGLTGEALAFVTFKFACKLLSRLADRAASVAGAGFSTVFVLGLAGFFDEAAGATCSCANAEVAIARAIKVTAKYFFIYFFNSVKWIAYVAKIRLCIRILIVFLTVERTG